MVENNNDLPESADIRLEMKVKNNILHHAIFDNYSSVAAFCKAQGLHSSEVGRLLNFKASPFDTRTGEYRKICKDIELATCISAEVLFPEELYKKVEDPERVVEISSFTAISGEVRKQISQLPAPTESPLDFMRKSENFFDDMQRVLETLTFREREIIKLRYGIDQPENQSYTLDEVAAVFKVTRERIRQIEAKALRKLQIPWRTRTLDKYVSVNAAEHKE